MAKILDTLKLRANANDLFVSMRTDTRSVDDINAFLEQTKGETNEKYKKIQG